MNLKHLAGACAVAFVSTIATGAGSASATTVLSDGTFASISVVGVLSDPGVTSSGSFCSTCGNGGGAGLNSHFTFTSSGSGRVGFIDNVLSYDPAVLGAISTLSVSIDKQLSIQYSGSPSTFNNNAFDPFIRQGGKTYLVTPPLLSGSHVFPIPGTSSYDTLSASGLTANDFLQYDPVTATFSSGHPDFTTGLIVFGLASRAIANGGFTVDAYWDNFTIEVSQTPIPATLPLFASGAGVIGLLIRRRRRNMSIAR
jgi:hypothetical protein